MKLKFSFLIATVFGLLLFVNTNKLQAQNIIDKSADELKLFNATQAVNSGDYVKAINLYKEVLANRPKDAVIIFHIGNCYYNMKEFDKAKIQFESSKEINDKATGDLRLLLGRCYQLNGKLDDALIEFAAAKKNNGTNVSKLKEIDYYFSQCQTAKSLMANPKPITIKNAGATINSNLDDKRPTLTADMKTIVFTSRREEGKNANQDTEGDGGNFEDIYTSEWDSTKNNWGEAYLVRGAANSQGHDAACSISPDGKQLFLYINNLEDARGGDIYVSKISSSGKWGTPKNIGAGINTTYFEDGAVLSPDGNILYFMSERGQDLPWKGQKGYGRCDIWMAKKKDKSTWDEPTNLGPVVNTEYDEGGIFPAADGKTLYFCSNGHNSMGGYDIFMTRMVNDVWSKPVNLGFPINTIKNERMFIPSSDGKIAYVDSDRENGLGERDIWIMDMSAALPKPHVGPYISILTGSIFNGDGIAVAAELVIFDANGNQVGKVNSNDNGIYQIQLEGDKSYEVKIDNPGYKSIKESVKLDVDKVGGTFELVKHFILYKE